MLWVHATAYRGKPLDIKGVSEAMHIPSFKGITFVKILVVV
jgi:hypothetical protein